MSATNLPPELLPTSTTIEYVTKSPKVLPAFLLVVDTCLSAEDLAALKDSLLQLLELLPNQAYVGLISYGHHVQVHELAGPGVANPKLSRLYAFSGEHEISARDVHVALGVGTALQGQRIQANPQNNFVVPLAKCREVLEGLIDGLQPDCFPVLKDHRPLRATGIALNVAIALLENTFAGLGGRIMMFMGGPATVGPGFIVGSDLKEAIRTHNELRKEAAPRNHAATRFYEGLAERAANNSHAVDLFSCSLNQTGLLEMRKLCQDTGGVMILADGFDAPVFQKSLTKMFEKDANGHLKMGFAATMDVHTTSPVVAAGCIGPVFALPDKGTVSDNPVGIGGNCWRLCAFDPTTTYAVFFDMSQAKATKNGPAPTAGDRRLITQFQTNYQHASGLRVVRVTTIAHNWSPQPGTHSLIPGIDQECAAALMARLAVYKNEKQDADPLTLLDQHLIKLMKRFGQFTKGLPSSFVTPPELSLYAQFMYYYRRGPLIQVFNNSPDETVFFRYCLSKEVVGNILVMMQPSLDSYVLDQDPEPVFLSATSVTANNVLLLDTFFHIVVHTGSNIAAWRKAGYHLQPEYENLAELVNTPKADAENLMSDRMPLPIYVECDQGTSQSRFLKASVDPAITHLNAQTEGEGQMILTEDASLQIFIDKLTQIVCKE
jgi:protein transport protein SEC23